MLEAGTRRRNLPAPPHIVFEALTEPDRDPSRPWLDLLPDERRPTITGEPPATVQWSGLWPSRPDAVVRFDLRTDGGSGTNLRWTLLVDEPLPDASKTGHLRHRINRLVHGNLRATFGQ